MADTRNITISGNLFEVSVPFAEGHALTAAQAHALNQVRCENLRNNFAKKVKDAQGDAPELAGAAHKKLQGELAEYDAAYEFNMSSGGSRVSRDPVETEARRLTRAAITKKLKEAGKKVKDFPKEKMDGLIESNWQNEAIMKLAQKNVKAKQAEPEIELAI